MKINKKTIKRLAPLSLIIYFLFAKTASAQSLLSGISCIKDGSCQLDDMVTILFKLAQIILGLVGSLSLLAFVYGGVLFLISGGSSERVTKGKQAITGAVVGLVIVFTSYAIITFIFTALNIDAGKNGLWATSNWSLNLK